jgi:asparaginyl-tRNA synthetase
MSNENLTQWRLIKLKNDVVDTIRAYFRQSGALESYYNKITQGTGACESVPTVFIVQNTKELSFLSQTDQLTMEQEILEYGIDAVWTLGRSYRNEPRAGDGRHLSEFALLEYEKRNIGLQELLKTQYEIVHLSMRSAMNSPIISNSQYKILKKYLDQPMNSITYTQSLELLKENGITLEWGDDFNSEVEQLLCKLCDGPIQVTHYPESIKFFNMYRTDRQELKKGMSIEEYNEQRLTVECCDYLLPHAGETFGGSRREESYDTLTTKLKESRMLSQMAEVRANQYKTTVNKVIEEAALQPFVSYLELFNPTKHPSRKSVMRSGFGLGMGRLIQFLLGTESVIVF